MYFHVIFFLFLTSICGFGNALTFKSITDAGINLVESSAKNVMLADLRLGLPDYNLDDDSLANLFGNHSSDPSVFVFTLDERELLKRLSIYVKEHVDKDGLNAGLAHFQDYIDEKKKSDVIFKDSVENESEPRG